MGSFMEVFPMNLSIFLNTVNQLTTLDLLELSKLFPSILIFGAKQILGLAKLSKLKTKTMHLTQRYSFTT